MEPWPGHLPITFMALSSIVNRAATGECDFSRDERVLFTACEFWAAVLSGELRAHLGARPADRLRTAGIALNSLGAVVIAQAVFSGIDELRTMSSQERHDEYIARLEQQLQKTDDRVDALIGLLAQRCVPDAMPVRQTAVAMHFS